MEQAQWAVDAFAQEHALTLVERTVDGGPPDRSVSRKRKQRAGHHPRGALAIPTAVRSALRESTKVGGSGTAPGRHSQTDGHFGARLGRIGRLRRRSLACQAADDGDHSS
jgi:hypothetical protein